jgi:hypothetical protein
MTFRGVNQQRYDPPYLGQTWVWCQVDKLGKDTLPKNQYDWPNPKVPTWIDETWTWRQVGMLGKDKLPNRQQDWPNPTPVLWNQPWASWYTLELIGKDKLPFRSTDRPNPQPIDWSQSWSVNLLQTTLSAPAPIPRNQYDWPNPQSIQWYQSWFQAPVAPTPFNQLDWPNPTPVSWYQDWNNQLVLNMPVFQPSTVSYWDIPQPVTWSQNWTLSLLQSTLAVIPPKPFSQSDWPNPVPVLWNQPWSNRYNLFGQDKLPNRQQDWPNPQPISWYQDYRLNLIQTTLLPPPSILPLNQYDWPLNYLPLSLTPSWTYTSQFLVPVPIPPVTIGGQWSDGDPLAEGYRIAWEFAKKLRQAPQLRTVSEAAVELGRKGGLARTENMTPKQRSQLASHAAKHRWK